VGARERRIVSFVILGVNTLAAVACGSDANRAPGKEDSGGQGGEATRGGAAGTSDGEGGTTDPESGGAAGHAGEPETAGAGGATPTGGAGEGGAAAGSGGEAGASEPPDPSGGAGGDGGEGGSASTPVRDPRCDDANDSALAGTGSAVDPYLVCLAEQLTLIATGDYTLDRAYALGEDLDVSALAPAFATIGDDATPFTGTFDGRGHTVRGLPAALLAGIEADAVVREISLEGEADASLEPIRWGFLAWQNRGLVQGVHVDATLTAPSHSGLLIGLNQGTVEGCSSRGEISGDAAHVGGLVGVNEGVVRRSFSAATVSATQRVGGLVGRQSTELASIEECYAVGAVSGQRSVGGLLGTMFGGGIVNSYARSASVTGAEAGGLVGDVTGTGITLTHAYAAAEALTGEGAEGLVGEVGVDSEYTVTASYFHDSATGSVGEALTTAAMQSSASYQGWDFTAVWKLDTSESDYPVLRAFHP
jgi:hypothetical protein